MQVMHLRRGLAVIVVLVAALFGTAVAAGASPAAAPFCGITWGSLDRVSDVPSSAALVDARTGRHDCFDRVVFELEGTSIGYAVRYTGDVLSEGRGKRLDIAGGAKLSVVLRGDDFDITTGVPTYQHQVGEHVANVGGDRTLRDLVYGGSFEGYTTFGVGVRARLPFRVLTLAGPDGGSRIVIDVAHRWSQ